MNLRSRIDRLEQVSPPSPDARPGLVHMSAAKYRQMSESGKLKDLGRSLVWVWPDVNGQSYPYGSEGVAYA